MSEQPDDFQVEPIDEIVKSDTVVDLSELADGSRLSISEEVQVAYQQLLDAFDYLLAAGMPEPQIEDALRVLEARASLR